MTKYFLIESNDPWESGAVAQHFELAHGLATAGNEVTLFLVQNGVLPSRASSQHESLGRLTTAGVTLLADAFSLRERGIPQKSVAADVRPAELDVVVDALAAGTKTVWL